MPELPDVETFRRRIVAAAVHQKIRNVELSAPKMVKGLSPAKLKSRLEGHTIAKAARHGKHLLLAIDREGWLDLHFGTSGHPQYVPNNKPLPPYTRMALDLENGKLAYVVPRKIGRISMVNSPDELLEEAKLGPDALDPHITFALFARLAKGKGTVKCWLMDQSQMAGIGNIYSDEILYHAKLHPARRAGDLSEHELRRVYEQLHAVLRTALAQDADPRRLPDWLLSHRRQGDPCPACEGKIERIKLCGRSSYFCPSCLNNHRARN